MPTYLAVYHGPTVPDAEIIAVTTDTQIVSGVAASILDARDLSPDTEAARRRHVILQRIADPARFRRNGGKRRTRKRLN